MPRDCLVRRTFDASQNWEGSLTRRSKKSVGLSRYRERQLERRRKEERLKNHSAILAATIASTIPRSDGVVILMFAVEPSTTSTRVPVRSTRSASSVATMR